MFAILGGRLSHGRGRASLWIGLLIDGYGAIGIGRSDDDRRLRRCGSRDVDGHMSGNRDLRRLGMGDGSS